MTADDLRNCGRPTSCRSALREGDLPRAGPGSQCGACAGSGHDAPDECAPSATGHSRAP